MPGSLCLSALGPLELECPGRNDEVPSAGVLRGRAWAGVGEMDLTPKRRITRKVAQAPQPNPRG